MLHRLQLGRWFGISRCHLSGGHHVSRHLEPSCRLLHLYAPHACSLCTLNRINERQVTTAYTTTSCAEPGATTTATIIAIMTSIQLPWWFYLLVAVAGTLVVFVLASGIALGVWFMVVRKKIKGARAGGRAPCSIKSRYAMIEYARSFHQFDTWYS